jgi:hypothetical protein
MALAAIPDDINRHIEAVLVLSKRDVLLKVLREADLCLQFEHLAAATLLAGVVLEETSLLVSPDALGQLQRHVEIWREMRNRAAHPLPRRAELDTEEVKAMLTGIRTLLEQIDRQQGKPTSFRAVEDALAKIRGKYTFVGTSVDEFLKRKHDDLELEAQK